MVSIKLFKYYIFFICFGTFLLLLYVSSLISFDEAASFLTFKQAISCKPEEVVPKMEKCDKWAVTSAETTGRLFFRNSNINYFLTFFVYGETFKVRAQLSLETFIIRWFRVYFCWFLYFFCPI